MQMKNSINKNCLGVLLLLIISTKTFATQGALSGVFSVSATKKVQFSQGNLQYQASTKTWRFAANQYDYIGANNKNISSTYTGWIDLFGYGTSGYNSCNPYRTNTDNNYGGQSNIAGTNYDWGKYCKISNGGNQAALWRTLTQSEWKYIISQRTNAANLVTVATVNNVKGLILLPDSWSKPSSISLSIQKKDFSKNKYTTTQWATLQNAGAVFLPASGMRENTTVSKTNETGRYWSSSFAKLEDWGGYEYCGYQLVFGYKTPYEDYLGYLGTVEAPMVSHSFKENTEYGSSTYYWNCYIGSAVRLVQDATVSYTVTFNSNGGSAVSPASKTVSSGGTYGTLPTPTRTGHTFDGWYTAANGGTKITSTTTVSITANQTLYAHWTPRKYTVLFNNNYPESNKTNLFPGLTDTTVSGISLQYDPITQIITLNGSTTASPKLGTFPLSSVVGGDVVSIRMYDVSGTQTAGTQVLDFCDATETRESPRHYLNFRQSEQKYLNQSLVSGYNYLNFWIWYNNATITYTNFKFKFQIEKGSTLSAIPSPSGRSVSYAGTYGTLPTPTRTGYTFDGWYTATSGGTKITSTTTVTITANQTLYAHWTINKYAITTAGTNGTVTGGGSYKYNTNATLNATPAECYVFARWSDGNTANPRTVTVTGDATYTAIFEKLQYTITTAPDDAEHGATEAAEL